MKKLSTFLCASGLLAGSLSFAQTTQRIPLYETFTSSTCPPCNSGNVHLESLFNDPVNEGKFTSLKYQMSGPGLGDPYYNVEGGSRAGFYIVTGIPRLFVDGSFNASPVSLDQSDMDAMYAVEAEVILNAYYQVNEATQTVSIQVDVKALTEISGSGGLFLRTAIFEKQTTGNVETNGETRFEHVMKKMLPAATGTYLGTLEADATRSFTFEYTFEGDYRLPENAMDPINNSEEHSVEEFSDLGVVVWVQRNTTKEVYQSAYAKAGLAGIDEKEIKTNLTVYPNPTSTAVNIAFQPNQSSNNALLEVVDFTGKVIYQEYLGTLSSTLYTKQVNTEALETGVYFITLRTDAGQVTKKLSVVH